MTRTQAYRLSRLTVSRDHTRSHVYPNTTTTTTPHPPPPHPHPNLSQHHCDVALPPVTSNLLPPPLPLPLYPQPIPSGNSHLDRLDPKGCPPLGPESPPSCRIVSLIVPDDRPTPPGPAPKASVCRQYLLNLLRCCTNPSLGRWTRAGVCA